MSEEIHPILAMMLSSISFLSTAEKIEDTITPLPEQLDFGPGDAALLAGANTMLESDFVVARCVDAAKHAESYPDWEERLWNSYVLCELFSSQDPSLYLGWVSRLKLMPMSGYRYRQARKWLKEGFPDDLPAWVEQIYQHYTDQLAKEAPTMVPTTVTCPNCGETGVEIRYTTRTKYKAKVGRLMVEGEEKFVPLSEPDEERSLTAELRCPDCDAHADLADEEWLLPGS